jgi:hypothetical protein
VFINFQENFTIDNDRFVYDLATIDQFYKIYQRLAEHWHEAFPDETYDLKYELLVTEPENNIKNL